MDDLPIRAGVGRDGRPQTFEELLTRKLSKAQHPTIATTTTTVTKQPAVSHSPTSSQKSSKRVSFTQSTRSPLSRSQRLDLYDGGESKENSSDGVEEDELQYDDADGTEEYRRIEDTLRALRVEADMEAIADSKYDYDDDAELHSTAVAESFHEARNMNDELHQADDTNAEAENNQDDGDTRADYAADANHEEQAEEESQPELETESAEERLRRQRQEAYHSYARSAKPLKTKREDNPTTQPHYHNSPTLDDRSLPADISIVHTSAISPAIAQLFFSDQSPSISSTVPPVAAADVSLVGHNRSQSGEWGVGSGYGKGRARVSMSEKPAAKQTGKRVQQHRTNQYLTSTATATAAPSTNRATPTSAASPLVTNGQSLPSALHAQLNALQHEISQYQTERNRLQTLQHETQRELHLIKQQRQQLITTLNTQQQQWEIQRTTEQKKLKQQHIQLERSKRLAMGYHKGSAREERSRVEELEEEMVRKEKEWKEREGKYKAVIERMRREAKELQGEVKEVREREMREEKKRVEEWERNEKEREKEKDAERRRKSATATSHYHFATVTPSTQPSPAINSAQASPAQRGRQVSQVREIVVHQKLEQEEADDTDQKYSSYAEHKHTTTSDIHNNTTPRSPPHTTAATKRPSAPLTVTHSTPRTTTSTTTSSSASLLPLPPSTAIVSTVHHPANKIEHILSDRSRLVLFADGTRKHIAVDGSTRVDFPNGDYKITTSNSRRRASGGNSAQQQQQQQPQPHTMYYYASRKVLHRSYEASVGGGSVEGGATAAMDEYVFEDGQVERHWKDGRKDIRFADGSRKTIDANGRQTTVWPDDDGKEEAEQTEKEGADDTNVKRWGVVRSRGVGEALGR